MSAASDSAERPADVPSHARSGRVRPRAQLTAAAETSTLPKVLRPIGHDDRLSIVDHLDELRSRLIVCAVALVVAFGVCFWQNHPLLHALNRALPATPKTSANHLSGLTSDSVREAREFSALAGDLRALGQSPRQSAADRQLFGDAATHAQAAAKALPQSTPKRLPITIGVGEPFAVTLTVSFYFALLFALPVLIYEAYAFVLPALNPSERRAAVPAMVAAPVLFLIGLAFAYWVVLSPAVHFLQGYNSQNFDILVQAKPLYTFEVLTMAGIGLAFQLPAGAAGAPAARHDQRAHPDPQLALRYGRNRGHSGRDAGGGSGDHRARDAPPPPALSRQYRDAQDRRPPRRRARRRRPLRPGPGTRRRSAELMLFDLRSRGRRRTVQAVYLGLALLMGGGLVLFGVGAGNGFGGLLDAFKGGSSGAQTQVASQAEKDALRQTRLNPSNPAGWSALVQARWTAAGQGSNFNAAAATFTSGGKKELAGAIEAWQHYASLVKSPDPSIAILAARAYQALGNYAGAASAWEAEAATSPTEAKGYECLAVNAYAAKQTRKGDLAAAKAVSLTPKASQLTLKAAIQQAKTNPQVAQSC